MMIKGPVLYLVWSGFSIKFHHLCLFFSYSCWCSIDITSPNAIIAGWLHCLVPMTSIGGDFLESSRCMLALKEPPGTVLQELRDGKQHTEIEGSNGCYGSQGSQVRPPHLFSADTCGDLLVTLQSLSRQGEKRSLQLSGKVNSMTFTFDSVLPGKYKSKNRRQHFLSF